ncbi:class D sortase [Priestia koreensis]|uniref:class D sortase n=1 Tax=Priestia koreensis TaxID=284581 RepID=UPI0034597F4B
MRVSRKRKTKRASRLVFLIFSVVIIAAGVFLFATNGKKLWDGQHVTEEAPKVMKKEVVQKEKPQPSPKQQVQYDEQPEVGEEIGTLTIPAISSTLPIIHGTNEDELAKGVGHYAGSVLPGMDDNSVLSGHRDTVFRKLGDVGKGDLLEVETRAGLFTYRVNKVRIVDKDDRTVIVPKPRATLTVSTCYPFYYVGPAPKRYILVATLVEKDTTKHWSKAS